MKYPKANGAKTRAQNANGEVAPAGEPFVSLLRMRCAQGCREVREVRRHRVYRIPSFSPRRSSARLSARRWARVSFRLAMPTQTS